MAALIEEEEKPIVVDETGGSIFEEAATQGLEKEVSLEEDARLDAMFEEAASGEAIGTSSKDVPDKQDEEEHPNIFGFDFDVPLEEFPRRAKEAIPTLSQLGDSVNKNIQNFVDAFSDIPALAGALKDLGVGTFQKFLVPFRQEKEIFPEEFAKFIDQEYGSVSRILHKVKTDFVGAAGDSSVIFGGLGGILKQVAKATTIANKAQQINAFAKFFKSTGKFLDPINAAKTAVRMFPFAFTKAFPDVASNMVASALQVPLSFSPAARQRVIQTAMKTGFVPSTKDLNAINKQIDNIVDQIDTEVVKATKAGKEVSVEKVLKAYDGLEEFEGGGAFPNEYLKAIKKTKKAFAKLHGKNLTPEQAQIMKRTEQIKLNKAFGEMKNFTIEVKKAIPAGLRQQLEDIHPILKELNPKAKELIELEIALSKAAGRLSRREVLPTSQIAASAAAATAEAAATRAGLTSFVLLNQVSKSPRVKLWLGRALNKAAKLTPIDRKPFTQLTIQAEKEKKRQKRGKEIRP